MLLLVVTLAPWPAAAGGEALPAVAPTLTTIALGAACVGLGLALPIPDLVAAVVAVAAFGAGALLLRLVPAELLAAVPFPGARRTAAP